MNETGKRPSIQSLRPILTTLLWILAAAGFGFSVFLVYYSLNSHDNAIALLVAFPFIFLSFCAGIGFTLFGIQALGRISGNKALIIFFSSCLWTIALCFFFYSLAAGLNYKTAMQLGYLDSQIETAVIVAIIGIAFVVAGLFWYRWATRYYKC